jgi:hypothetical protein
MSKLVKSRGYLGDYSEDSIVYCLFNTYNEFGGPGEVGVGSSFVVYKDVNNTESSTGVTNFYQLNNVAGLNQVVVDLSSDAFYETGSDYTILGLGINIWSETVVGEYTTVNAVIGSFSIENRNS